jgi:hypothetical protein
MDAHSALGKAGMLCSDLSFKLQVLNMAYVVAPSI